MHWPGARTILAYASAGSPYSPAGRDVADHGGGWAGARRSQPALGAVHARRAKGTRERGRGGSWFGHRDGDSRADRVIHCECRILKAAWQRVANKVQGDGSGGAPRPKLRGAVRVGRGDERRHNPRCSHRHLANAAMTDRLVLKRASASRPSGEWRDEDHDVLADGVVSRPRPIADARDAGASAGRSADRVSAHGQRRVRALNGRHRAVDGGPQG
jgi:hypothetical protein